MSDTHHNRSFKLPLALDKALRLEAAHASTTVSSVVMAILEAHFRAKSESASGSNLT